MPAFDPKSLTIAELFGNQDSLYKIPRYQRPYKWEDDQVEQLWDDIFESYESGYKNYFLGSVITVKDNQAIDIIDGQQRLTTLMILFCVLRDIYPKINFNATDPEAINNETIKSFIYYRGRFERLTLLTDPQHRGDFEKYIIKGNVYELKKPYKYEVKEADKPKFKFINTALIFKERLEDIGEDIAGKFINYLFNRVSIIRIDCEDKSFAIKLFQILNDRGMDLTASDLIKSYLLLKIEEKYKDETNTSLKDEEENQFITEWRRAESICSDTDLKNMNDMFIVYEYYLLAQNPKKSLSDELEAQFKKGEPNEIIHDFVTFAETYKNDIFNKHDKLVYSFRYLRWSFYWKAILMTALHTNYEKYQDLAILLRRFYYLYWIAGKTLSKVKQLSFNLIRWVKEDRSISYIKDEINKKLENDNIIIQAINNLKSQDIYNTAWSKPLYLLVEYEQTDNPTPSFIELSRDLHLEHILPKEYKKFKEWDYISDEVYEKYINTAGNLTLLSGKKNIEASNNPFEIKMKIYQGKGKYETKDTKITSFRITQNIVDDYNKDKYNRQWNREAIEDRVNWYCAQVDELLDIVCDQDIE